MPTPLCSRSNVPPLIRILVAVTAGRRHAALRRTLQVIAERAVSLATARVLRRVLLALHKLPELLAGVLIAWAHRVLGRMRVQWLWETEAAR